MRQLEYAAKLAAIDGALAENAPRLAHRPRRLRRAPSFDRRLRLRGALHDDGGGLVALTIFLTKTYLI